MRTATPIPKTPTPSGPPSSSGLGALRSGHTIAPPVVPNGDLHMGAREDQISRTMPPKSDDDEPKQG